MKLAKLLNSQRKGGAACAAQRLVCARLDAPKGCANLCGAEMWAEVQHGAADLTVGFALGPAVAWEGLSDHEWRPPWLSHRAAAGPLRLRSVTRARAEPI